MAKKFLPYALAGAIGIYIASRYIEGVSFSGDWFSLLLIGALLGFLNAFINPILQILSLPLRILTLNLFGLAINMATVWFADAVSQSLDIKGLIALFWTTLVILLLNIILWKILSQSR